ncbi:MAG: sirohydrochlorin chelatase [Jatrophihabitantaceae bacterium]
MPAIPRLLIAAHGTESGAGRATTAALVRAIAAARPQLPVSLCFLDVAVPSLRTALDRLNEPVVLVPLLLSTGYHVLVDIPAVVAGRPNVRVARHLGPSPLVVDAVADRLAAVSKGGTAVSTVLVAVGSSRAEAAAELAAAAGLLGGRLGRPVLASTLGTDVRAELAPLPGPVEVATYLLAAGRFTDSLRAAASGLAVVSEPIGAHPALVRLVLERYDEAAGTAP